MSFIQEHSSAILDLCKKHKVKDLYAFGSVLTKDFNSNSDIDFIVNFQPIEVSEYVDNYFDLKFSLEEILERPIDLLEEQAIKNPYLKENINQQKELVYGH